MKATTRSPTVSVVMTTYNGERFLAQQLDSVIDQTYPIKEILICDDCSTDSTLEILQRYQQQCPLIRVVRNEKNQGYVKNFEHAISLANSEYVALCDQDDIWLPEKLERLLPLVADCSIVYCDSMLVDEAGNSLGRNLSDIKNLAGYKSCLPFAIGNSASGHAMVMSKSFVLSTMPFPEFMVYDWWLAFCAACNRGLNYVDQPLVLYRQHAGSIVGAVRLSAGLRKKTRENETSAIRQRMKWFAERSHARPEHPVIQEILESYEDFSLSNNTKRALLFLKYKENLLAIKKRSAFRKTVFCFKMWFKII